ncbi:MAG: hypothetical protein EXR79_10975 [Myxococcales bacterium]|nr:hypothetical protein [Myxococcales bacterium]
MAASNRLQTLARVARRPASLSVVLATTVSAGAAVVVGTGDLWERAEAPEPGLAVEVPVRPVPGAQRDDASSVTVTVRWGHNGGAPHLPGPTRWDGWVSLDCGEFDTVAPLAFEPPPGGLVVDDPMTAGDELGPVVRGAGGDHRIYFRSRVGGDWDGLKIVLTSCSAPDPAATAGQQAASTLRIATPFRSYVARLDWSVDDFVSLGAGPGGSTLDVHIAANRDARNIRGARVTRAQPPSAGTEGVSLEAMAEPAVDEDPVSPLEAPGLHGTPSGLVRERPSALLVR